MNDEPQDNLPTCGDPDCIACPRPSDEPQPPEGFSETAKLHWAMETFGFDAF